jgi:hypothetical protein
VVAFPIASWAFEPVDTDANKAADTSDKIQERLCISDTPQGKIILAPGLVKVCSLFILQAGQRGRCMPSNANGAFDEQLFDTFFP